MTRPGWGPVDDRRAMWTAVAAVLVSLALLLSMWLVRIDGTVRLVRALVAANPPAQQG